MFSQVGPLEIILVLAIALIVLGPKRLPDAGRSVGRGLRNFKSAIAGDDEPDHEVEAVEPPKAAERTTPSDHDEPEALEPAKAAERTTPSDPEPEALEPPGALEPPKAAKGTTRSN